MTGTCEKCGAAGVVYRYRTTRWVLCEVCCNHWDIRIIEAIQDPANAAIMTSVLDARLRAELDAWEPERYSSPVQP